MRIGIIGAGFTGLSAAHNLLKNGHSVSIFEKDEGPGGLALGYQERDWNWSLEKHYHHWFTNDKAVLNLAKEINHKVIIKRPKTSVYVKGDIFQLDSPLAVLKFPYLSILERIRMGIVLAFLRYNPIWRPLEKINTKSFLQKTMGRRVYETIWEPQLINKFGGMEENISLAWFWARIRKRTAKLAYPQGGFLHFANALVSRIKELGGEFVFKTEVLELKENGGKVLLKTQGSEHEFDKVIVTLPSFFFIKIAPSLTKEYKEKLMKLKGLGAVNLVLRLKSSFLKDGTYWLSVCDKKSPIMAVVDHSNFMDVTNYNGEHIVYLGNYLPMNHRYFKMDAKAILKIYDPFLKKINEKYKSNLIGLEVFKAPFAQPIIPVNYSKMIPPFKTPITNVFLANIQQVYPWDRGTNYAVELGERVVDFMLNEK
ncbi:MAG: Amine oxidase [Candidatus Levybacteria bacterium GW2011_GWC2_40_7]|nr:MAG: Amine oxidase [Candidatus Levybacteria bacterium GW2011_GWC2_40_7]